MFGKESFLKTYNDVARVAQNFVRNMETVSDDVFTATVDYKSALISASSNLIDYSQRFKESYLAVDKSLEHKIGKTLLSLAPEKAEQKIGGALLKTKNNYSLADQIIEQKISGTLLFLGDGTRTVLGQIKEQFSDVGDFANNFVKQKLVEAGNNLKNFEEGFKSETGRLARAVGEPFIKTYRSIAKAYKFVASPWQEAVIKEESGREVVVKRIEVSKVVEPVKEVTRETIQQITRVDDAALAEVRANMTYLEQEIGKRLYAPGGVVSQTIYVTEPVSSPKIYQENGEIVLQTLGSGNVILSAATGLQLYGQQVVIESTNVLNPLIYLADKTRIGGDTTITGNLGVGSTSIGGTLSATGAATIGGNLTVTGNTSITGDLTIVGNETITGVRSITASSTSAVLTVNQTGTGPGAIITGGNVGIGTSTPRYKLDVWGDMAIGTSTGTNVPLLYVDSGTGLGGVGIGTTTLSGNLFTVGTTTPSLVVANNGYVGIGTAAPSRPLHIRGASGQKILIESTSAGEGSALRLQNTGNTNSPYMEWQLSPSDTDQQSYLTAHYSGATTKNNLMVIRGDGNVGIGTTTPRYKLDVWGDMAIGTSTGTNVPALYVQSGNGGRVGIGTTTLAGLFTVGTTTPSLVVAANGYVGIASSTPSDTFAVQGNLISSGSLTVYSTVTSTYAGGLQATAIKLTQNPSLNYVLASDANGYGSWQSLAVLSPSNWQYIGVNAIRPTSTVGIIVSASSTFAGNLSVGTSTTLFVDSGNNLVGIASSTPNEQLSVAGNIMGSGNMVLYGTAASSTMKGLILTGLNVSGNGITNAVWNATNIGLAYGGTG
ncbi:MAG: hypothetical protein UV98_C0006G0021, partial [Parcubacteria group bacterium GW2011_GWB1_43_6]